MRGRIDSSAHFFVSLNLDDGIDASDKSALAPSGADALRY